MRRLRQLGIVASPAWNCVSTAFAVFATTGSGATDRGRLLTRSSASCRRGRSRFSIDLAGLLILNPSHRGGLSSRLVIARRRPRKSSGPLNPRHAIRPADHRSRLNAKRSTGPRSIQGRDRSRLNALKHGLNLPAQADPEIASHINQLAHSLAGPLAFDAAVMAQTRTVAEANYDLARIRLARVRAFENMSATFERAGERPVPKRERQPAR